MRLIMMGTGPFAAPTFEALYAAGYEVVALVTRPPRNLRGRYKAAESPLPAIAERHGTPVVAPEDVNDAASRGQLAAWRADLLVVCDYGQILSNETLATARLGGINLHGSLLPKYRGAAPVHWAIYHGETETGVTVIHMTPRLDAGPCIGQVRTPIGGNETTADVETRLAQLGAPLVCQCIEQLAAGQVEAIAQDPSQATRARRLRKEDGEIDWSRPAKAIADQIRAFTPWPRSATWFFRSEGEPLRVSIDAAREVRLPGDGSTTKPPGMASSGTASPGTVLVAEGEELLVQTGDGGLALCEIQPAGKRRASAGEFMRGYRVRPGERFARIETEGERRQETGV
ncbi:MAG: methionyl-tRNA formyltransferase [Pirellulales bacterium]